MHTVSIKPKNSLHDESNCVVPIMTDELKTQELL
jgi:hypothetical protein